MLPAARAAVGSTKASVRVFTKTDLGSISSWLLFATWRAPKNPNSLMEGVGPNGPFAHVRDGRCRTPCSTLSSVSAWRQKPLDCRGAASWPRTKRYGRERHCLVTLSKPGRLLSPLGQPRKDVVAMNPRGTTAEKPNEQGATRFSSQKTAGGCRFFELSQLVVLLVMPTRSSLFHWKSTARVRTAEALVVFL